MNEIIKRFCPNIEFESYEDMKNDFKINVPSDFNFGFDVVDEWAKIEPEKTALVWTNDEAQMKSFSFKDIKEKSNQAANMFKSLGIKKGDIVMLVLKQRPEVWFCFVALHKIGAVVIPGSFQLTPKDLVFRMNATKAKLLITVNDEGIVCNARESLKQCPTVENYITVGDNAVGGAIDYRNAIDDYSKEFERPQGEDKTVVTDPMLIYFSSGTTGMPKMVRHDFSSPLGQITTARYWQCVQENKVHLTQTDSGWAKFAWGKIYGQWICGAAIGVYDTERFHAHEMIGAIMRLKPATFCAPATIYRVLIKEDLSGYDFSFIEHASVAGEPLNPEVFNQLEKLIGVRIHEGFGQSETSVLLANFPWFDVRPGSMGKPAPVYDIDLLDENGKPCEDGIVGSICIKGVDKVHPTGLFREYWQDNEAMKKSFKNGVYNTGDTAWRDAQGYYWFVGRNDDVIKCSGYRIGPFEVESALMEHPCVLECAITSLPDLVRGQIVKATVVLSRGYSPSDELKKELQNHVKRVTAPYKYPRAVEFVNELPKTSSGKIKRTQIRANDLKRMAENE
ncbi:MAG TPA: AMP-binding protein [Clostridia bacterium]|nr:AMP-binding protein [Clostridia bacterium]